MENNELKMVLENDKKLRQMIAEYFMMLNELNDSSKAIDLLSEHVSIMVTMINELRKG